MKIILKRIINEFNKIYDGTKRVHDTLNVNGKSENQLDVRNAATLGNKSESELSVKKAVLSEKSGRIQAFDSNGQPNLNLDGEPVYKTENNLSVLNTRKVGGLDPKDIEVSTARKLKVGEGETAPIINVSSLITNPNTKTVYDSDNLNGKPENELSVKDSITSERAFRLIHSPNINEYPKPYTYRGESELEVSKADKATYLISDNGTGTLKRESDLITKASSNLKVGNSGNESDLWSFQKIKNEILSSTQAQEIDILQAQSSQTILNPTGQKVNWVGLMDFLRTNTDGEQGKVLRALTLETTAGFLNGTQLKDWILNHSDMVVKIGQLTSKYSTFSQGLVYNNEDISVSYFTNNVIPNIKVKSSLKSDNSDKLDNKTVSEIVTESFDKFKVISNWSTEDINSFVSGNMLTKIKSIEVNDATQSKFLLDNIGTKKSYEDVLGVFNDKLDSLKGDDFSNLEDGYKTIYDLGTLLKAYTTGTQQVHTSSNLKDGENTIDITGIRSEITNVSQNQTNELKTELVGEATETFRDFGIVEKEISRIMPTYLECVTPETSNITLTLEQEVYIYAERDCFINLPIDIETGHIIKIMRLGDSTSNRDITITHAQNPNNDTIDQNSEFVLTSDYSDRQIILVYRNNNNWRIINKL